MLFPVTLQSVPRFGFQRAGADTAKRKASGLSLTIVVGGQFGSEGKGKTCSYLASETDLGIRSGGPNSGHTVSQDGAIYRLRQIPSTFVNPNCLLALAAGAVIGVDVLLEEVRMCEVADRLVIDPKAVVIDVDDIEKEAHLRDRIASCKTGTGSAIARKVMREPDIRLAESVPELQRFLGSVSDLANEHVDRGNRVLIEGNQGIGLSLHHGPFPYVTGRDTSPGTLCGEVGVSPLAVTDVLMVIRTFPIRVPGNSGPLPHEITWDDVTIESQSAEPISERTTVTQGLRRVARFSWDVIERSMRIGRPSQLALNFVDYLDARDFGRTHYDRLSERSRVFVEDLQSRLDAPIALLGTGPGVEQVVDLRSSWVSRPSPEARISI